MRTSTVFFEDDLTDFGFLYGRVISTESFQFSYAAGLAIVTGYRSEGLFDNTSEEISPTIGIPIGLQANWEPTSFIGLGISGFANLNPKQSFAGLTLSLQLGKLQ